MADLNLQLIAEEFGKSLEHIAPAIEAEIQAAVTHLAHAAYASMVAKIQSMSMNPDNRKAYLKALKIQSLGADQGWIIFLNGDWPTKLEEGFPAYSIKDQLLKSTKTVAVGSRAGQPWVRKTKKGKKMAVVPFQNRPSSGEKSAGDLGADIRKIMISNRQGKMQSITKIFKDLEGKPLTGKVAVAGKNPDQPNLSGLTKYQFVSKKGHVSSIYMTYRVVSEDSPGWRHPGHPGYQLFKEAEKYVTEELQNIVQTIL